MGVFSESRATATYRYDSLGRRVQRVVSGSTWNDFYDLNGHMVSEYSGGSWYRGEVYAGGRHLVSYLGRTYFSHQDWLGTERVRTNDAGTVAQTCTSGVYGDNWTCTNGGLTTQISYAGMELDSETGLYHTLFRYYNPRLGAWMTPDPAGMVAADQGDSQTLNRYAYVGNDPINYVDPLGLAQELFPICGPQYPGPCGFGSGPVGGGGFGDAYDQFFGTGVHSHACGLGPGGEPAWGRNWDTGRWGWLNCDYAPNDPIISAADQCLRGNKQFCNQAKPTAVISNGNGNNGGINEYCSQVGNNAFLRALIPGFDSLQKAWDTNMGGDGFALAVDTQKYYPPDSAQTVVNFFFGASGLAVSSGISKVQKSQSIQGAIKGATAGQSWVRQAGIGTNGIAKGFISSSAKLAGRALTTASIYLAFRDAQKAYAACIAD